MNDLPPTFWLREKTPTIYAPGTSLAPIAITAKGIVIIAEILSRLSPILVPPEDFKKFEMSVDRKDWAPLPDAYV